MGLVGDAGEPRHEHIQQRCYTREEEDGRQRELHDVCRSFERGGRAAEGNSLASPFLIVQQVRNSGGRGTRESGHTLSGTGPSAALLEVRYWPSGPGFGASAYTFSRTAAAINSKEKTKGGDMS